MLLRLRYLCLVAGLALGAAPQSQAQTVDPTFPVTDIDQPATVANMLRQADGGYIVSGNFQKVNGTAATGLIRLTAAGRLDQNFTTAAAVQTPPDAVRQLPSGRILLFSPGTLTVGGQAFRNLVQLNADGTLGPALATGTGTNNFGAQVVAVQPDGKILLGGLFTSFNGIAAPYLVRLNADGSVDQPFMTNLGTSFTGFVRTLAVQPDGKIIAGGGFQNFNGTGRHLLVRLNANGTIDNSFVPAITGGPDAYVAHLALDPRNNDVVVDGALLRFTTGASRSLFRLKTDGSADSQFFPGLGHTGCYLNNLAGNDQIVVDDQGRIVIGGCFEKFIGTPTTPNTSLVRLLPNGQIDAQFATGPTLLGSINAVQLEPNGGVTVAGNLKTAFSLAGASVVRLTAAAQPDLAFQPDLVTPGRVAKLLRQADGKLLIAGRFTSVQGQKVSNITRLNADGSRDASFAATGPNYAVEALAQQPDGKILVGGRFTEVAGNPAAVVARLEPDGRYDASFAAGFVFNGTSTQVTALALQPDGNVLVGGVSLTYTGTFGDALHRLLPTGQLDQAYENNLNANPKQGQVLSLKVLPDGRAYVGGYFTASNGSAYTGAGLMRLLADGRPDPAFTPETSGVNVLVNDVAPLANGQVLVGGHFSNYNGANRVNMVRLNANGSVDPAFNANMAFSAIGSTGVSFVVPQPNGRFLIGSGLTMRINGVNQGTLARLLPTGELDASFAASTSLVNGAVHSALVESTGELLVGGQFSQVAGQTRWSVARLTAPQVLPTEAAAADATTDIWPVPAHDQLHLRLNMAQQPRQVALLDLMGRQLRHTTTPAATTTLSVRGLAAGVYVLRVSYATGAVTRRIVVE
ncbi:T9SS type A sorting domain-containing protein [Hymenobacter metallicola]|uniref:T9SS type A sorting domain-containing protein n=1 Tax=Hymenobacter metallicola TaxID=2563114 RepID=A0A4Z0QAA0_9BACT|nr:T9SS type A sorting domain-containing protein [Hymenobacter metallicola]TGE26386.1 T9SS type A sorting domain-containing protein [Hymenobacter metallicola]